MGRSKKKKKRWGGGRVSGRSKSRKKINLLALMAIYPTLGSQ